MSTLLQDLRFGLRMLAKAPLVSSVAALSLALGIAANAGMFAVLNGFLFEPLPFEDQEGLVIVGERRRGATDDGSGLVSMGNFRDYEAGAPSLVGATAYTQAVANLTGFDVPERLNLVVGTPNLFEVLGVVPALGRGFRPEDGAPGANVVVLDHGFWERKFLGDPGALGRPMTLDGESFTVVGVLPEEFDMIPANVDAFRVDDFRDRREERVERAYISFGRLAPGATPERVRQELEGVFARAAAEHPDANADWEVRVRAAREFFPGPTDTRLVKVLTAVTLFGLLIACANVANLLLSRAEERQAEVAVRTAMGASRGRILRQLLTESVTLGVVAGVVGVALAVFLVRWIQGAMPPELPRAFFPELDPVVLLVSLLVAVLAGVVFGLVPALHAVRGDLRDSLGGGSRGGTAGRARKRLRSAFVVAEVAVALGLLAGAAFMVEAFEAMTGADPGFRQDGLLTFSLTAPDDRYPTDPALARYQEELVASLGAVPGVQGVALMSSLPRSQANPTLQYAVAGREPPAGRELPRASHQAVNGDYFRTLEIDLVQGRTFDARDREGGQRVAIVSRAFADREFPGEDPLARTLAFQDEEWLVVGVVEDAVQDRIPLQGDRGEAIYTSASQTPLRSPSFAVRTTGEPTSLAARVREAIWAVNPDQPVALLRTLDAHVAESLAGPRAISVFLSGMAAIALLLSGMGIYGVMAHSVAQQHREIGIRMALGANRGTVLGMVTRNGLGLAGAGMLLGLPLAWIMYQSVASTLNFFEGGVGLRYAAAVTLALAAVAALATFVPARRASAVAPAAAVRE